MDKTPVDAILIDARNLLHRAVHASRGNKPGYRPRHPLVVSLGLMHGWVSRFRPASLHLFWDCDRASLWRRKLDKGYKDKPPEDPDVHEALQSTEVAMRVMAKVLGIRQYRRDGMEADDLIYSACRILAPANLLICSSDSDYLQLAFRMRNVSVFDPLAGRMLEIADHDPVISKALRGDRSDLVDGYTGIGKVHGARLAKSITQRHAFIKANGARVYARNLALIDLSLCPHVLMNDIYVQSIIASEAHYKPDELNGLTKKLRIPGLLTEFSTLTDIGRLAEQK